MIKKLSNKEKLVKLKEHQAAINALKEQRTKEIAVLLDRTGGLFIDDELLAGFIKYSLLEENKDAEWLSTIYQIGKEALPSKKSKSSSRSKKTDSGDVSPEGVLQKGA